MSRGPISRSTGMSVTLTVSAQSQESHSTHTVTDSHRTVSDRDSHREMHRQPAGCLLAPGSAASIP